MPAGPRRWLLLGSLGCGVILLMGAVAGLNIYWKIRYANRTSAEAEITIQGFFTLVSQGEIEQAHDFLSRDLKAKKPLSEFSREVAANPEWYRVPEVNFGDSWKFHFTTEEVEFDGLLTLQNGERLPAFFHVAPEEGYWVIKAYRLGNPSAGG